MKYLIYILTLFISITSFSQGKIGSSGDVIPTGSYPILDVKNIKGGVRPVSGTTDRDAIPLNFRYSGMIVTDTVTNKSYQLQGGITNYNWVLFGSNDYEIDFTRKTNAATGWNKDGAGIVQLGNYVYILGGWNSDSIPTTNSQVYRAHVDSMDTWTKLSDAPWFRRHSFGYGTVRDTIFVWGSDFYSSTSANDIWGATAGAGGTLNWFKIADLPYSNRILFGATIHNGDLYTIGGTGASGTYDTTINQVYRSTDGGRNWTLQSRKNTFSRNLNGTVASYNNALYVIGGGIYAGKNYTDAFKSRDNGVTWTAIDSVPVRAQYPSVVVHNGKLYWMFGSDATIPTNGLPHIYYLDNYDKWHNQYNYSIQGRHATAVTEIKYTSGTNEIALFGGTNSTGATTNSVYVSYEKAYSNYLRGDTVHYISSRLDSGTFVNNIFPNGAGQYINFNNQIYSDSSFKRMGFFTGGITPNFKLDYRGVNFMVGANDSVSSPFESTFRTANNSKMFRMLMAPYATDGSTNGLNIGLIQGYITSSNSSVYLGGNAGIGTVAPTKLLLTTSGTASGWPVISAVSGTVQIGDLVNSNYSFGRSPLEVGRAYTHTSGVKGGIVTTSTFTAASGTGVFNAIELADQINQTVSASGITRGLYVNNTLTSVTGSYRAIEVANGNSIFGTTTGSVGIGANTSINASALLDITSTAKGILIPRMTTAQRDAISSPADGLMVYNTDHGRINSYSTSLTAWRSLMSDGITTKTYAATTNIDFNNSRMQTVSLTGDVTFTTSNLRSGSEVEVRIIADASLRNFTFPGTWTFMTSAAPASIAASKTGLLILRSFGTTDANVVASYVVQP